MPRCLSIPSLLLLAVGLLTGCGAATQSALAPTTLPLSTPTATPAPPPPTRSSTPTNAPALSTATATGTPAPLPSRTATVTPIPFPSRTATVAPTPSPLPTMTVRPTALPTPGAAFVRITDTVRSPTYARDHTLFGFGWFQSDIGFLWVIVRSIDAGKLWTATGDSMNSSTFPALVFSPTYAQDGTMFIFSANISISEMLYGSLSRSTDGGHTWTSLTAPISIAELILSPTYAQDHTLLLRRYAQRAAASIGNGIYRSTDGGTTWIFVDQTEAIGPLTPAMLAVILRTGVLPSTPTPSP